MNDDNTQRKTRIIVYREPDPMIRYATEMKRLEKAAPPKLDKRCRACKACEKPYCKECKGCGCTRLKVTANTTMRQYIEDTVADRGGLKDRTHRVESNDEHEAILKRAAKFLDRKHQRVPTCDRPPVDLDEATRERMRQTQLARSLGLQLRPNLKQEMVFDGAKATNAIGRDRIAAIALAFFGRDIVAEEAREDELERMTREIMGDIDAFQEDHELPGMD